jgi:hypothetical protein
MRPHRFYSRHFLAPALNLVEREERWKPAARVLVAIQGRMSISATSVRLYQESRKTPAFLP